MDYSIIVICILVIIIILTILSIIIYKQYQNSLYLNRRIKDLDEKLCSKIDKIYDLEKTISKLKKENEILKDKKTIYQNERLAFLEASQSNLTAIPYMAEIVADYETYGFELMARKLDYGYDQKRINKVKALRELRKDAKAIVEKNKESQYQLAYLLELIPNLKEIIETDYSQLPLIDINNLPDYDYTRDYLSRDEYQSLSTTERNQLALDRYVNSHNKTKWQIGRDYELYIGHIFQQKGYDIDYFGSYMGLNDLGRDLIATKNNETIIIQCKYWSSLKEIHEKHITQLYGTVMSYCIENNLRVSSVTGLLVTNITLSKTAKKMADMLDILFIENAPLKDYPRIKCNIGHNSDGETKIYHLPFDQQYDSTKINKKGEFFAMTVKEAEDAGFRRAYKWSGD